MAEYSAFALLRNALTGNRDWKPAWRKPEPKQEYDVIIIGGGGHGLSTAYYLAKEHGITNVAVLERGYLGSGNVGRNTTAVRSNYMMPESIRFYEHSMKMWENLSHDLNYNVMFSQRGVLNLGHSPAQLDDFAKRGNAMRHLGADAVLMTPAEIKNLMPIIDISASARFPVLGGLMQWRAGTARHDAVAWGYARAASQLGVHIIEDCEVTGIHMEQGRAVGVETTRGRINAGKVGIAVAGHTSQVAAMAGLKLPVESHILQAFVTEAVKPMVHHVVSWGAELFYLSQSDKGGMVFGGHIDGFNTFTQRGQLFKIQDVMQCAVSLMPFMSRMRLLRHWGGIQDMTPDGSPFICRTPVRDLYLNGGWCYQGFKATPASGWTFAHTIAHDSEHELNRDYSFDRFEKGGELDEHGTGNWTYKQ